MVRIDRGRMSKTWERKSYGYELAGVVDGGFLLDLPHQGSFRIGGGAEGGVQGIHSGGEGKQGVPGVNPL